MKNVSCNWNAMASWSAAAGIAIGLWATGALAAPPAPASSAQADAGEPRANTSAQADAGEPRANTSAQADAGEPRANTSADGAPGTPPRAGATGRAVKPAAQKAAGAADRVDLSTATVTGDREQPKVMYVVPWKSSDMGNLSGKPMNSLLDEALAPVDRDEFKREVAYFDAVKADRPQNGTPKPAANEGEK